MIYVEDLPINNLVGELTNDELYAFCIANPNLRIERDAQQNLIIMSPVGGLSGYLEEEIQGELRKWAKEDGTGLTFSSSTGFLLPNGAMRSPDASWVSFDKWNALTEEQKKKFPPFVPDFVVELRSATDSMKKLKAKAQEWIDNGVKLLWLIDPEPREIWIYRTDGTVDRLSGFDRQLSGEEVLPGFSFDLQMLQAP